MAPKGPISRSSGSKPSDELRITGMSTIADRLGFRPRNHDALGDRNDRYGSEFASVAVSGCRQLPLTVQAPLIMTWGSYSELAEGEGFEPPKACTLVVFKTTAIDHSAIPPATINNTAALTPLGDAWGQRSTKAAEARRCRSWR